MTMSELGSKLDDLIAVNDYEVWKGYKAGADRQQADNHATEQYARFPVRLRKDDCSAYPESLVCDVALPVAGKVIAGPRWRLRHNTARERFMDPDLARAAVWVDTGIACATLPLTGKLSQKERRKGQGTP
jgi:hypothetical protein